MSLRWAAYHLWRGLVVERYPACCVLHFAVDEALGRDRMGDRRGDITYTAPDGRASTYVPCALHAWLRRHACESYDPYPPEADEDSGRAAPVVCDFSALGRWGSADLLGSTDDGATGTVTVRYSGPLLRVPCAACDREAVAAAGVPLNYCPWCGKALTSAADHTPHSRAVALSRLRSGGTSS